MLFTVIVRKQLQRRLPISSAAQGSNVLLFPLTELRYIQARKQTL
jgi:hypothetical protein